MEFTIQELKAFRTDFADAVKDLEKKYGVSIDLGNISYSRNEFSSKINVVRIGNVDDGVNLEKERFKALCGKYGFTPADYKSLVVLSGRAFELVGFKSNARTNPCIIRRLDDGKMFKCSVMAIKGM